VWVGFDSSGPLGKEETGGRAALPAWIDYMREALDGVPDRPPEMPGSLVIVRIDPNTGLRVGAEHKDAIFEIFRASQVPLATQSELRVPANIGYHPSEVLQGASEDPF
jgi:penicillin-binding protein 1A